MNTSAIVLAGGKGKRLGRDKALLEIDGEPLILRVVQRVEQLCSEVLVATAADHPIPLLEGRKRTRVVVDIYPDKGALGGLYTGLKASANQCNLVVACDMPFLNLSLLEHMIESSEGSDVLIPRLDGYYEPLHAVYSRACLSAIESVLGRGFLKILSFLPCVKVRYLAGAEIDLYDPQRLSFLNINTEEDLRRAEVIDSGR